MDNRIHRGFSHGRGVAKIFQRGGGTDFRGGPRFRPLHCTFLGSFLAHLTCVWPFLYSISGWSSIGLIVFSAHRHSQSGARSSSTHFTCVQSHRILASYSRSEYSTLIHVKDIPRLLRPDPEGSNLSIVQSLTAGSTA